MHRVCLLLVFFCSAANAVVSDDDAESGSGALEPSTSTVVVTPELRAEESANAMKAQKALMKSKPISMEKAVESIGLTAELATQEVTNALNKEELKKELEAEQKPEKNAKLGVRVIEGDIIIPKGQTKEQYRKAIKTKHGKREIQAEKKWDVVIPYQFPAVTNKRGDLMLKAIREAINDITEKISCIKFVQRFNNGKSNMNKQKDGTKEDFIKFIQEDGCYSYIGKQKNRGLGQEISIGKHCEHKGTVIHEIMHALGFWHEHSRYDRDKYVKVNRENIEFEMENNFDKYPHDNTGIDKFFPYDYGSIMHYPDWAFSKNGRPTLQARPGKGNPKFGQRDDMSQTDIEQIKELYCKNAVPTEEYVKDPMLKNNKYVAVAAE